MAGLWVESKLMALVERNRLIERIAPPLDELLATQLVDEFISAERRYIQRDWGPSELDGGQFAEASARILYHLDSGILNYSKSFGDCVRYLEGEQSRHTLDRKTVLHIVRVLRTVYKFRNDRGVAHISPTYEPNHMDSKLVMEAVRWVMNETLRVFWSGDRETVAKVIRELLQFDVPAIGKFEDALLVQRTDLTAEEEILLLLHYAGEQGFSRTELGKTAMLSAPSVSKSLASLCSPTRRQAILLTSGKYRLTDLGSRRIRDELSTKLLVE